MSWIFYEGHPFLPGEVFIYNLGRRNILLQLILLTAALYCTVMHCHGVKGTVLHFCEILYSALLNWKTGQFQLNRADHEIGLPATYGL